MASENGGKRIESVRLHSNDDDRSIEVFINGASAISTNYDDIGWSGMDAVKDLMQAFADAAGVEVEETEGGED